MTKNSRAKEYAMKAIGEWDRLHELFHTQGEPPYSLEHKLHIAWRQGFEAGQRHQIKIQKAKEAK